MIDHDLEQRAKAARAFALELAPSLASTGPAAPGTVVLDTTNGNAPAYVVGMSETWATVVYIDEPDCSVAAGNEPGRWKQVTCPTSVQDGIDPADQIIGCGSANIAGPDFEGLYDCLNCGMWFRKGGS
jgi:hypothetical protein